MTSAAGTGAPVTPPKSLEETASQLLHRISNNLGTRPVVTDDQSLLVEARTMLSWLLNAYRGKRPSALSVDWPSYTETSKNAMYEAARLAREEGSEYIRTSHLLLALLKEHDGPHRSLLAEGICTKCGGTEIHVGYHKDHWHPGCPSRYSPKHDEHLHMTCRNCQFEWDIPPLDAKPSVAR
jgi:hypothetical protein